MAFPHTLLVRGAWLASAVVAVVMISNKLREDDHHVVRETRPAVSVGEVRVSEAPVPAARTEMKDVILSLAKVGDSESRSQGFTLTRPMDIRVLALGEGSSGEMNDYGAILEATTRKLARMARTTTALSASKRSSGKPVASINWRR